MIGDSPAEAEPQLFASWEDLPLPDLAVVAVDMPIGLAEQGRRACDLAARACLPPGRKSSVFATPARGVLGQPDYAAANAWSKATCGVGLSKQAWYLTPKIAELDAALTPALQAKIHEAHPELAFHRLSGGKALPPKRKPEGKEARRTLLSAAGFVRLDSWLSAFPRAQVQADDLLDAAVLLLTAQRIVQGTARRLPEDLERDACDLDMAIWV